MRTPIYKSFRRFLIADMISISWFWLGAVAGQSRIRSTKLIVPCVKVIYLMANYHALKVKFRSFFSLIILVSHVLLESVAYVGLHWLHIGFPVAAISVHLILVACIGLKKNNDCLCLEACRSCCNDYPNGVLFNVCVDSYNTLEFHTQK